MNNLLHRPLCDLLGCRFPIILAGMGGVARADLVTEVTLAGGFGFLGMVREPVSLIRSEVATLRSRNVERFGVNLIPAATSPELLDAQITACLELDVPVISLFWDVSASLVNRLRNAGRIVACQVGSEQEALTAEKAGAQVLIVQGVEAGGHVRAERALYQLLPEVVAATRLPVLAAGGLVNGQDLASVMHLGAQGAVYGTALIATHEAFAHDYYKQRLVAANDNETCLTEAFHINWPAGAKVRVLNNSVTQGNQGDPFTAPLQVIGDEAGRPVYLFSTDSPLRSMTGNFEAMALYAGMGVHRITEICSAADRVHAIADDATQLIQAQMVSPPEQAELSSSACLAHESHDRYMGFLDRAELLDLLNDTLEISRAEARLLRTIPNTTPQALSASLRQISSDAIGWCGVLTWMIYQLRGEPSRQIAAFYRQAQTIDSIEDRLAFLGSDPAELEVTLKRVLPWVGHDTYRENLRALVNAHKHHRNCLLGHLSGTVPDSN